MRYKLGPVTLLVVFVLALAGCSPVSPETSREAWQSRVGSFGQINVQLTEKAEALTPFAPSESADAMAAAIHFHPLFTSLDGRLVPRMADWWSMSPDGRSLTVILRPGTWSDGSPISAADVVYSVTEHLRPANRSPVAPALTEISGAQDFLTGRTDQVAGVVADTARSVVITLDRPDPEFAQRLTQLRILPEAVYRGQDLSRPETFREPKVGAGAYVFDSWEGTDAVRFRPNPELRRPASLKSITARYVPTSETLAKLSDGTIDLARLRPSEVAGLPERIKPITAPGNSLTSIVPLRGPLADNVQIRQALLLGLDRHTLINDHLAGNARVVDSALFQPDWVSDPGAPEYSYDPVRAKELLSRAGWRSQTPIKLVLLSDDSDTGPWEDISRQLREVGLNVEISIRPLADQDAVLADPSVAGIIDTWTMATQEPSLVSDVVSCGAAENLGRYCDPRLDAQLDAAISAIEPAERERAYRVVHADLAANLPRIPLWVPDAAIATPASYAGFSPLLVPPTEMSDRWHVRGR